jgi:GT2 family glycosyltransferase
MTSHNRREKTFRSLGQLFKASLPPGASVAVYLVDAGSTDGTVAAVRREFPHVDVIRADASLHWNQGMRLAWEHASRVDPDGYLWLNDDTFVRPDALSTLIDTLAAQEREAGRKGIVVGSCFEPTAPGAGGQRLTYGGRTKEVELVQPGAAPQPVQTLNGNLVLVSREAYHDLGNLSPVYQHMFGDLEYGWRAQGAGVPVWLAPGLLAECSADADHVRPWMDGRLSLRTRLRALRGPKGLRAREIRHFQTTTGRGNWMAILVKQYTIAVFAGACNIVRQLIRKR